MASASIVSIYIKSKFAPNFNWKNQFSKKWNNIKPKKTHRKCVSNINWNSFIDFRRSGHVRRSCIGWNFTSCNIIQFANNQPCSCHSNRCRTNCCSSSILCSSLHRCIHRRILVSILIHISLRLHSSILLLNARRKYKARPNLFDQISSMKFPNAFQFAIWSTIKLFFENEIQLFYFFH